MINKKYLPLVLGGVAFLSAWQATDFSLDYRAVLGAALAALCGYITPKNKTS